MNNWRLTAEFIWTCWSKKFLLGSKKHLRTVISAHRTVLKLAQQMWLRSCARTVSEAFGTSKCGDPKVLITNSGTWTHWRQPFNQLRPNWTKKRCIVLALRWKPVSDSWSKQNAAISKISLFIVFSYYFEIFYWRFFFTHIFVFCLLGFFDG